MSNEPLSTVPSHVRKRWDLFIKVFRETGSVAAGCAAASPHLDSKPDAHDPTRAPRPGYRTFLEWSKRYPELAAEFEEAKVHALGLVEKAIAERSMTPERVPVFSRGVLVGERIVWRDANALLLRRAARLSPEDWATRTQSDVRVEHANAPGGQFAVTLEASDVMLLPPAQRALFVELLTQIRDRKEGINATPQLIDSEPAKPRPALIAGGGNEAPDAGGGGVGGAGGKGEGGDRDTGGS
jgi:hypothetical protein